jgi:hypothetical protein
VGDLFDVVYHAIQQPLDIDFYFSSEGISVQALVGSDVGKDGFGHCEALRVNLSPPFTINLAGHFLGQVGEFNPDGYPEISGFTASSAQTPQPHRAALTISRLGHIYSAHHAICVGFFRYPRESFTLRTPVVVGALIRAYLLLAKSPLHQIIGLRAESIQET